MSMRPLASTASSMAPRTACSREVRSKKGAKKAASWRLSEKTSRLRPASGGSPPPGRCGSASSRVCAATAATASSPGRTVVIGSR